MSRALGRRAHAIGDEIREARGATGRSGRTADGLVAHYACTPPEVVEALKSAMIRARLGLPMQDARLPADMGLPAAIGGPRLEAMLARDSTADIREVAAQRPHRCPVCGFRYETDDECLACCPRTPPPPDGLTGEQIEEIERLCEMGFYPAEISARTRWPDVDTACHQWRRRFSSERGYTHKPFEAWRALQRVASGLPKHPRSR